MAASTETIFRALETSIFAFQGSGQIRAKIYAKPERMPVQCVPMTSREVFHSVLGYAVRVTNQTAV